MMVIFRVIVKCDYILATHKLDVIAGSRNHFCHSAWLRSVSVNAIAQSAPNIAQLSAFLIAARPGKPA
jgi:hypothetical protein